jgi:DNA-binding MarR family transcriptional regulator
LAGKSTQADLVELSGEVPVLEDFFGYALKRAYVVFYEDYRAALGEDGFAPRVFSALALVVQYPNITQSAVARHLGVIRSGLVAIIDELEARGYVTRTSVPGDRRVQALVPTEAGKAAYLQAKTVVQSHEAELLADFTDAEKQELKRLLQKVRTKDQG